MKEKKRRISNLKKNHQFSNSNYDTKGIICRKKNSYILTYITITDFSQRSQTLKIFYKN